MPKTDTADASQPPRRRASDLRPSNERERLEAMAERARHVVAAREEERRRLAAELHDVASTNLATIKLNLSSLARMLPPGGSQEAQWMDDTQELLAETIAGLREICNALRPAVLDGLSLAEALQAHCRRFSRRTGIEVDLDLAACSREFAPAVALMLLRVAQEALWNSAKHANARQVQIRFEVVDTRRRLSIVDDGDGFEPGQPARGDDAGGIGIHNMQERALSVGAVLEVVSLAGKGTRVSVDF